MVASVACKPAVSVKGTYFQFPARKIYQGSLIGILGAVEADILSKEIEQLSGAAYTHFPGFVLTGCSQPAVL